MGGFTIAYGCMVGDIGEDQAYKTEIGVSTATILVYMRH